MLPISKQLGDGQTVFEEPWHDARVDTKFTNSLKAIVPLDECKFVNAASVSINISLTI
jgi:hypothetical protein